MFGRNKTRSQKESETQNGNGNTKEKEKEKEKGNANVVQKLSNAKDFLTTPKGKVIAGVILAGLVVALLLKHFRRIKTRVEAQTKQSVGAGDQKELSNGKKIKGVEIENQKENQKENENGKRKGIFGRLFANRKKNQKNQNQDNTQSEKDFLKQSLSPSTAASSTTTTTGASGASGAAGSPGATTGTNAAGKTLTGKQNFIENTSILAVVIAGPKKEARAAATAATILESAKRPDRITVAVCLADADADPETPLGKNESIGPAACEAKFRSFLNDWTTSTKENRRFVNIRVLVEPSGERTGPSNALSLVFGHLWCGERMVAIFGRAGLVPRSGWDVAALNDWHSAWVTADAAATASAFSNNNNNEPSRSTKNNQEHVPAEGVVITEPAGPSAGPDGATEANLGRLPSSFSVFRGWDRDARAPMLCSRRGRQVSAGPLPTAFFSSDFCLAPAFLFSAPASLTSCDKRDRSSSGVQKPTEKDVTVCWDPWLQRLPRRAVDWTQGLRIWTHGWDFYSPSSAILAPSNDVYTPRCDETPVHPFPPPPLHLIPDPKQKRKIKGMREEEERLGAWFRWWALQGLVPRDASDLSGFGLGRVRTEQEYRRRSGVDWRRVRARTHAYLGFLASKAYSLVVGTPMEVPIFYDPLVVMTRYASWIEFHRFIDDLQRSGSIPNDTS